MSKLTAPLDLDAVMAFMNSLDEEYGTDELHEPAAMAAWFADRGLVSDGTAVSPAELQRAHTLRGALRDLAEANHDGEVDADATARLNAVAEELQVAIRFGDAGEVSLVPTGVGTDAALGSILTTVAAAAADDVWRRVKLCRSDTCRYAFFDASRNRSGRWCSMAVCGNREKVRAYRERHD